MGSIVVPPTFPAIIAWVDGGDMDWGRAHLLRDPSTARTVSYTKLCGAGFARSEAFKSFWCAFPYSNLFVTVIALRSSGHLEEGERGERAKNLTHHGFRDIDLRGADLSQEMVVLVLQSAAFEPSRATQATSALRTIYHVQEIRDAGNSSYVLQE